MKKAIISIALLISLPLGGWFLWGSSIDPSSHPQVQKVLYYQDSMHPWIKSDQPGKCTVCGMDLTPIYEEQQSFGSGDNVVALSSNSITVLHVQAEEVKRKSLLRTLRVAGTLEANETKKTIISAPASGRIEETAVDYVGVEVHEGQRLLTFYSPELTQQKYRYLVRAQRSSIQRDPTGGLAKQTADADPYYNDLVAPQSGTVIERNVSRGQYVSEGERLFTIADASVLWFRFDVYERQLPWLRLGQKVMVSLPAIPGKEFEAVVTFIDPLLDNASRTVKVRADITNPVVELDGTKQRLFKFGMYAEGEVQAEVPNRLAVPRAAVLFPGKSAYVYIDKGEGVYERRLIKLGRQSDELWEVYDGLEAGERVVTSGNVLMDAQAQFSQKGITDESEKDTIDLTPATVLTLADPASPPRNPMEKTVATEADPTPGEKMSADAKTRLSDLYQARLATNKTARPATSSLRAGTHRRTPSPASFDPVPYGGRRNMEGAMFVRMAELRNAELAEAREAKAAEKSKLTERQCQSLEALLAAAASVSQALAADDLNPFNESMTKLPALVTRAQEELGDVAPWNDLIRPLAEAAKPSPVASLAEARELFLPFSTAAVEIAQQFRKEDSACAGLKIYHCPMAPKPGLWMQAKGPLANPFYGAKMLKCGEEVLP